MFYETLEKLAEDKKKNKSKNTLQENALGLAGGAGVVYGASQLGDITSQSGAHLFANELRKGKKTRSSDYKKLLANMGLQRGADHIDVGGGNILSGGHFKDKHGQRIFFSEDLKDTLKKTVYKDDIDRLRKAGLPDAELKKRIEKLVKGMDSNAAFLNKFSLGQTSVHKRGGIAMGKKKFMQDADLLLHELGHGTGTGRKILGTLPGAAAYGVVQTPPFKWLGHGSNIYATAKSLQAGDKSSLDKAEKANRTALIFNAIHKVPELAEEARASIRAVGLGKKFGHNVNKKKLLGAYGTYAGSALGHLSPYLINKAIIHKKRKKLDQKKEQA